VFRLDLSTACALAIVALTGCGNAATGRPPVRIAAAASLTAAFGELGPMFENASGQSVTFSFGSSGLLAKQIREGAPFDLFAAADVASVDSVIAAKAADPASKRVYARGRIAVWLRSGGVEPPATLAELADPRFTRIAIASPVHAPYGIAAKEALVASHVWRDVESRLVFGENVRQSLQFAETGNVDVAIVAVSLIAADRENPFIVIPESLHAPITQALVICTGGGNRAGAEAFATFLATPEAVAVMARHGFQPPDAAEVPR
jgi:molybdate transport system substrate-binding protein